MKRIYELVRQGYKITFADAEIIDNAMLIDMRKGHVRKYTTVPFSMIENFDNAIDVNIDKLKKQINIHEKVKNTSSQNGMDH